MYNDYAPYATQSEAHAEWHLNSGVPMGTPGCPQDACHIEYDQCPFCCDYVDGACKKTACGEAMDAYNREYALTRPAAVLHATPWDDVPF
jgi:hypothetical protein